MRRTAFGQMGAKLGIRIMAANSPQAKGRIERNHVRCRWRNPGSVTSPAPITRGAVGGGKGKYLLRPRPQGRVRHAVFGANASRPTGSFR